MWAQTYPNAGLQIYQNIFPLHNQNTSKVPLQNNTNNNTNQKNNAQNKQGNKRNASQEYTSTYFDYGNLIGCVSQKTPSINVIKIQGPNIECAVTTRRTRFNIACPPVLAPSKAQYNILEHLENMLAQISIFDLLHTSPIYKEILDSVLHDSRVPTYINATKF